MSVFFFNDTATTEIYTYCHTLSLHDALPISLDPIYFSFEGSEALFLKHLRQKQAGVAVDQGVEIRLQDETGYKWRGRVDFTDNGLDVGSGTMRGRAVIANPDYFLTPGMFGNKIGRAHV